MRGPEPSGQETIIPLSKRKLTWTVVGAGAFVITAIAILAFASRSIAMYRLVIVGAGAVFFGLAFAFGVKRLRHMPPGLTLTPDGLLDNSNGVSIGAVRWTEVTRNTVSSISTTRFLVFHVRDPAPYFARGNVLQRMGKRANAAMVGSPVTLASVALDIPFDELHRLVQAYFQKYGTQAAPPAPSA
jgi:hypothetical protein